MNISRVILIIVLFIAFFEIGIFSSYTIVNGEVPDPGELIDMQVSTITSIFSPENVGGLLIKDPDELNVTNKYDLAEAISDKADVDGVNVENMTVTTSDDTSQSEFNATVTAYGYSKPKTSSGSIVISGEPDYKITVSVTVKQTIDGLTADLDTLKIESILKVYDGDSSSNSTYSNYDSGPSGSSQTYSYQSSSSSGSSSSSYSSSGSSSSDYSSASSSSYDDGGSASESSYSSGGDDEITINLLNPIFYSLGI
ncbi:hypothetical protein [uncultured Methanobrevibacter sp.]|uniref:hypothetical protein n=1 Tax=uncultured Methanobrevibacter sp. TaxID=253161 RepID=UPI00263093CA